MVYAKLVLMTRCALLVSFGSIFSKVMGVIAREELSTLVEGITTEVLWVYDYVGGM